MNDISKDDIEKARQVDLFEVVTELFPEKFKREGENRLRSVEHSSLVITRGKGFCFNVAGIKGGNAIDYMLKFEDMPFSEAVNTLKPFFGQNNIQHAPTPKMAEIAQNDTNKRIIGYLVKTRGLNFDLVSKLIRCGLLIEDENHNAAFVSKNTNFVELVGTLSDRRFKGILQGSDRDGYWLFTESENISRIYVAESAIDAVSLRQYQATIDSVDGLAYASLAGVKSPALERLLRDFPKAEVILAVDADAAGDAFAANFPSLRRIKPRKNGKCYKDWNEIVKEGL